MHSRKREINDAEALTSTSRMEKRCRGLGKDGLVATASNGGAEVGKLFGYLAIVIVEDA